jgi:hypothetical protein
MKLNIPNKHYRTVLFYIVPKDGGSSSSKTLFLNVLFNDAISCYDYTASVTGK